MSTIADLQKEVNRFSNDPDIGFPAIPCDGIAGPQTLSATVWALTSVNLDETVDDFQRNNAGLLIDALQTPADLTAQLDSLIASLQAGASQLVRAYIPCPTVASTPKTPVQVNPAPTAKGQAAAQRVGNAPSSANNFGAGLFGLGLPNWAVYGGGGVIALGIIGAIVHHARQRRALRQA